MAERNPTENLTIEDIPKPLLTFIQKYIELIGITPQEFWRSEVKDLVSRLLDTISGLWLDGDELASRHGLKETLSGN
jgi:hypothetical protein